MWRRKIFEEEDENEKRWKEDRQHILEWCRE